MCVRTGTYVCAYGRVCVCVCVCVCVSGPSHKSCLVTVVGSACCLSRRVVLGEVRQVSGSGFAGSQGKGRGENGQAKQDETEMVEVS